MPAPVLSAPTEICFGEDAVISAQKADSASKVSWYTSAGVALTDGLSYTVTAPAAGNHIYYAAQTGTCEGARAKIEFSVTKMSAPKIDMPAALEICSGEPIPVFACTGLYASSAVWYAGSGASGTEQNKGRTLTVSPLSYSEGLNTYSATVTGTGDAQCKSPAADISFTVKPRPAAPAVADPAVACYGTSPVAATTGGSADADLRWFWDSNLVNSIPGSSGSAYSPGKRTESITVYAALETAGCLGAGTEVLFAVNPYIGIPEIDAREACHDATATEVVPANARPGWTMHWQVKGGAWSSAPLVPGQASATYRMYFEGDGSCRSAAGEFTYKYHNPAVPTVTVSPARLCLGASSSAEVRVSVAGMAGGTETLYPGGSSSSADKKFAVFAELKYAGEYTSRSYSTMANGSKCWSATSLPIKFEVIDKIASPILAVPAEGCAGLPLYVKAQTATTGDTLYLSRSSDGSGRVPELSPGVFEISGFIASGVSQFYLWAENGCPSEIIAVRAEVFPAPAPFVVSTDKSLPAGNIIRVCQGAAEIPDVTVTSPGSSLVWYGADGAEAGRGEGTALLVPASTAQGADYLYTLRGETAHGCEREEIYIYRVQPLPVPSIIAETGFSLSDTLCVAAPFRGYSIADFREEGSYEWLAPSLGIVRIEYPGSTADKRTMRAVPLTAGVDTLRVVETLGGCSDTASIEIVIAPRAEAALRAATDAKGGRVFLYNESAPLMAGATELEQHFVWRLDGVSSVQSFQEYKDGYAETRNARPGDRSAWLSAYNSGGGYCADSARTDFYLPAVTGLYLPTAFSPRSSGGLVSVWKPSGYGLAEYEVWVYDFWGNLIWYSNKLENTSPAEGWTGRDAGGNIVEGDVFTCRVKAKYTDGTVWKGSKGRQFGNIQMIK